MKRIFINISSEIEKLIDEYILKGNIKNFFLIAFVGFLEIAIILLFIQPVFETNDDLVMNQISCGAMTGKPSEYLIFTNIIIGFFLKFLYHLSTSVNWYSIYLIASFYFAYVLLQYFSTKIKKSIYSKIILHLILLTILINNIYTLQFTNIASLCIFSGLILLLFNKSLERWELFLAFFLIVLGSLIRFDVLVIFFAIFLPIIIFLIINKKKTKLFNISLIALISISLFFVDFIKYKTKDEFNQYKTFNKLRSKLTTQDNPYFTYQNNKDILTKIGWSEIDFNLASNFNIDIGIDKFSINNLKTILLNINKQKKIEFSNIFLSYNKIIDNTIKFFRTYNIFLFLILFIFILFESNEKKFTLLLFAFLYLFFLIFFTEHFLDNNTNKMRLIFNFYFPFYALLIFFTNFEPKILLFESKKTKTIVFALFVVFLSNSIYNQLIIQKDLKKGIDRDAKINEYFQNNNVNFYVSWVYLKNFNIYKLPYSMKNAYLLGWLANSPFNKDKIEKYTGNIQIGVYNIYNREITWLFRNDILYNNNKYNEIVTNFYQSNYPNCNVDIDTIPINIDTLYKYKFFIKQ